MLYLLSFRAAKHTLTNAPALLWRVMAFIIVVLFAATDEIHQTFVPSRDGNPRDVIIDAIGACIGWTSINLLLPRVPKKLQYWVKKMAASLKGSRGGKKK
jgi:VanZ family protein